MLETRIAIVIPCYKVSRHILDVLSQIGPEVSNIYVIDDACPEKSGQLVESTCQDPRVHVIYHSENLGVGGATMTGYRTALANNAEIVIKIDGDGQMDPRMVPRLIKPIINGMADYTKGNRFYSQEHVSDMPTIRLLGNGVLSFFIKISSGYWNIIDPNNGFTAIHRTALEHLPLEKIDQRYFFESDLLFRLNTIRAVVMDVPIKAIYGNEKSNLSVWGALPTFATGHIRNFFKRVVYSYFLRDLNIASFELVFGCLLLFFGIIYGGLNWAHFLSTASYAPGGVIMLSALTVILGTQLLLSAINYDIQNTPVLPLQKLF